MGGAFASVNRDNKEYSRFRSLCSLTGASEDRMRSIMVGATRQIEITIRNRKTDMSYIVRVLSRGDGGDEYLAELYEKHDGDGGPQDPAERKIIFKNHVRVTRPAFPRGCRGQGGGGTGGARGGGRGQPAVSELFGALVLIGAAAGAGAAFYGVVAEHTGAHITAGIAPAGPDVRVAWLDLTQVTPGSPYLYADIGVRVSGTEHVTLSGDLADLTIYAGGSPLSGGADGHATAVRAKTGVVVEYAGVVELAPGSAGVRPGDTVTVEIGVGGTSQAFPVEVGRP